MHESFDLNIRRLVAAIDAFEGLTVIGGCAGHPNPQPDKWPQGAWYVKFIVQQTDQGWFALEFLAWAINNDYRRGGHQVLLSPIAPAPDLNEPGQSPPSRDRGLCRRGCHNPGHVAQPAARGVLLCPLERPNHK